MKGFRAFCDERDQVDEGLIRSGAVAAYAAKSRKDGDDAVRAYKRGQDALRRGAGAVPLEDRLQRLEGALDALFDGLIAQRKQIGDGVAVDVAGHMMTAKRGKSR